MSENTIDAPQEAVAAPAPKRPYVAPEVVSRPLFERMAQACDPKEDPFGDNLQS
jgi:hypothetical protein